LASKGGSILDANPGSVLSANQQRGIHDGSYALEKFKESADRVGLVFDPKF
jgi:hypothetical protein